VDLATIASQAGDHPAVIGLVVAHVATAFLRYRKSIRLTRMYLDKVMADDPRLVEGLTIVARDGPVAPSRKLAVRRRPAVQKRRT
jgi:hypothetical protein